MEQIEADVLNLHKGLKFVHINARSSYNKLHEIYSKYKECDVIVITETWLNVAIPEAAVSLEGFRLIRQDRYKLDLRKGGGICIYVRDACTFEHLDIYSAVTDNYEVLSIKIKFENIRPCYVCGVYRPPKGKPKELLDRLSRILENVDLLRNEVYILGDMNIDYLCDATLKRLQVKNFESRFNIKQIIDIATRVTETTAKVLDWIYTNSDHIANSGTINHNMSDHYPVFIVRKKTRNKIVKKTVVGRSYLRYITEVFQQKLDNKDWTNFDTESDDPSALWEIFENHVTIVLNEVCPMKHLTVPENKPKWLNNDILLLMRKRDKMYKEARRKKDSHSWRKAHFLRNRVEMMIKNYKKEKIQENLHRNRTNPRKFWDSIKEIWPKTGGTSVHSLTGNNENEIIQGDHLAEHINSYFANIGKTLADKIRTNNVSSSPKLYHTALNNHNDNIMSIPITHEEFLNILNDIDINKSSAIDNIRSMVLIDSFRSQLDRVIRIYNGSLTRCIFPTCWKKGTVIPLPKISHPKTASDMRPITLLPLPGKIMERIISNRLKDYLDVHNILTDKQHGFRKGRSTLSAIVEFLNTIYNNVNDNYDSFIIYLDLKKAFDTVSHSLLLTKLGRLGLEPRTVSWFSSYLTNRVQRTRIND